MLGFPVGTGQSSVTKEERVRIMKEFADMWFATFGTWPGTAAKGYSVRGGGLVTMLVDSVDPSITTRAGSGSEGEAAFEIALRRLLQADPSAAPEIIKQAQEKKWPPSEGRTELRAAGPSVELFVVWAKANLPAMIRWAEPLDLRKNDLAVKAKGFLMSRVDAATRNRWLTEAKGENEKEDQAVDLLESWALWDPKAALDFAAAAKDARMVASAIRGASWVSWGADNMRHAGLGAVQDFDFFALPEKVRKELVSDWSQYVMEGWGGIDIGETARYGLNFLLRSHYAPPKGLMAFFSGQDVYPDEGGMIDRTFCALRVWAVVKPEEMKAWIATQKDAGMRKALTWLLEHPWGGERKEKAAAKK